MPCAVPMCAAVYEPVCGSNGRTYSSECLMDADSCVGGIRNDLYKVHDGECYTSEHWIFLYFRLLPIQLFCPLPSLFFSFLDAKWICRFICIMEP